MENVIILGSGPAGLTAAIYCARADLQPLVLAGDTLGGQLMWTSDVENFPGFPEGIQGPDLMTGMVEQAKRFGARVELETVSRVDFSSKDKLQLWAGDKLFEARTVILAMGASHRWTNVPGEEEFKNRGVSACATCDGAFFREKDLIVVGGGDGAMEEATFLTKFASSVTVLVRGDKLRASKAMQHRAESNDKIRFLYNTELREITGDATVSGVKIVNNQTKEEGELAVQGVFVAIGLVPNTAFLENAIDMEKGYITVTDHTRTSAEGVFAAGDVHDYRYRQAVTAAGLGCMAALDVEKYLAANE